MPRPQPRLHGESEPRRLTVDRPSQAQRDDNSRMKTPWQREEVTLMFLQAMQPYAQGCGPPCEGLQPYVCLDGVVAPQDRNPVCAIL